jgi:hypothetical protein
VYLINPKDVFAAVLGYDTIVIYYFLPASEGLWHHFSQSFGRKRNMLDCIIGPDVGEAIHILFHKTSEVSERHRFRRIGGRNFRCIAHIEMDSG